MILRSVLLRIDGIPTANMRCSTFACRLGEGSWRMMLVAQFAFSLPMLRSPLLHPYISTSGKTAAYHGFQAKRMRPAINGTTTLPKGVT